MKRITIANQTFRSKSCGLSPEFDEANEATLADSYTREGTLIKIPAAIKSGSKKKDTDWNSNKDYKENLWGNNSGYIAGDYGGGTTWKPCSHPGDKIIYEANNKKLYASNTHSLNEFSTKWNLIIDLANIVRRPDQYGFVKYGNSDRFGDLRQHTYRSKMSADLLQLDWPDMGAPPATLAFWLRLWDLLPEKTVMACIGGHGRTGTCLASLMISDGMDYYTAVTTVRAEHCEKAIESVAQTKYLHALYLDYLRFDMAKLTELGDTAAVKDVMEDIKYAESHVPDSKSDFGGAEEPQAKIVIDMQTGEEVTDEFHSEDMKTVGGVLYIRQCMKVECKVKSCKDPSHQSWIDSNDDQVDWASLNV